MDAQTISWDTDELPWEATSPVGALTGTAGPSVLDAKLVTALEAVLDAQNLEGRVRSAAMAFLYLYMAMGGNDVR